MTSDKHRLPLGDRAIGHVEPLHQLRAVGHGRDQFTLCQQGIHPASEPVLADSVEGVGQFVAALVQAIAAGLGDLEIDDAQLRKEFEAIASKFRKGEAKQAAPAPAAPGAN